MVSPVSPRAVKGPPRGRYPPRARRKTSSGPTGKKRMKAGEPVMPPAVRLWPSHSPVGRELADASQVGVVGQQPVPDPSQGIDAPEFARPLSPLSPECAQVRPRPDRRRGSRGSPRPPRTRPRPGRGRRPRPGRTRRESPRSVSDLGPIETTGASRHRDGVPVLVTRMTPSHGVERGGGAGDGGFLPVAAGRDCREHDRRRSEEDTKPTQAGRASPAPRFGRPARREAGRARGRIPHALRPLEDSRIDVRIEHEVGGHQDLPNPAPRRRRVRAAPRRGSRRLPGYPPSRCG